MADDAKIPRRYFGKHAGVVLDNGPLARGPNRGVLRVEVPAILEETASGAGTRPIQLLANPCLPPGYFRLPAVGAHVWVEFASGELEQAIWSGVWYPDGAAPELAAEDLSLMDGHGNRITQTGDGVQLCDCNGNQLLLDPDGLHFISKDGYRVTLSQLLSWLGGHQHMGNMGSPTPLSPPNQAEIAAWKVPQDGT